MPSGSTRNSLIAGGRIVAEMPHDLALTPQSKFDAAQRKSLERGSRVPARALLLNLHVVEVTIHRVALPGSLDSYFGGFRDSYISVRTSDCCCTAKQI